MPTISQFFGIVIRMFFNDHAPPHFHAEYGGHKATFDIENLRCIEGNVPRRAQELIMDWAELHQKELLDNWACCQAKQLPKPVPPLE